jgi:uncharacterized repeat protein (TIGR01451 family)
MYSRFSFRRSIPAQSLFQCLLVALLPAIAAAAPPTVAYDAAPQPGNQGWTGNLGLDFNVVSPIVVTSLGAFNANGAAGFVGTIQVQIFNRTTTAAVGPVANIGGALGTLVNGDRFVPIPSFILPAGSYSIVAVGFSPADLNGNSNVPGSFTPSTENTGGGLITFAGSGRYDANTTLDFPATVPPGLPSNVFLAGTFQFQALAAPTFTKAFSPSTVFQSQTSTLTFTITNPNATALTGLAFTDTLPTGMTEVGVSNNCGGTVTPLPASVSLSAGTVAASSSCTISVTVQATAAGSLVNTTSTLTSNEAPAAPAATATLTVFPTADSSFQVRYSANLNLGESYIDITNTGANGAPLLGPGLGGASGNICVNVYAFDASEELVSCCSCLVTPDQTVNLGVVANLTSKTLTGVVPTSVTVKLLATLAGTGGSGSGAVCNNSAASATTANIAASGMSAWGTTLHPQGTGNATAETRFTPSTLSSGELASITGRCAAIIGNASGFGICSSCRSGALGGQKI